MSETTGPAPEVLARWDLLYEDSARGDTSSFTKGARVILHKPTVALLYPADFPPIAHRRPDFAGHRHVLAKFSFMLDELPAKQSYDQARLVVILDDDGARVLGQHTPDQAGAAPNAAGVSIIAENRGQEGFGWKYQAQRGIPLIPQVEFAEAVIELPRDQVELAGRLTAEAMIVIPRYGVLTKLRVTPAQPPVPFTFDLGTA